MDGALLSELKRLDVESWFNMNGEMLAFIDSLRPRVRRLGLLSNINEEGVRQLRKDGGWLDCFDARILSCEHRLLKPEPGIFELCLRELGEEASSCLFVDDLPENVEGARAVGMRGHVFKGLAGLKAELEDAYELVR